MSVRCNAAAAIYESQACELEALRGYGCDEAQGFLLSMPLDATLLSKFLDCGETAV